MPNSVLIASLDPKLSIVLSAELDQQGFEVNDVISAEAIVTELKGKDYDVVVADTRLSTSAGLDVIQAAHSRLPGSEVIFIAESTGIDQAIAGLKAGAFDYFFSPINLAELSLSIKKACQRRQQLIENMTCTCGRNKMAQLGDITFGAVHEMKNSLGAMRGLAELMSMRSKACNVISLAERLICEVDRFDTTLNSIYQIGENAQPVHQAVHLSRVLKGIVDEFSAANPELTFELSCHEDMPNILYDKLAIVRAFENIIRNAVIASNRGDTIKLLLSFHKNSIWFHCMDNGVGMSRQTLNRIFEPFFSTWKQHGCGLGLCMCRKTILEHGGQISIESEEGTGTKVSVELPLNPSQVAA